VGCRTISTTAPPPDSASISTGHAADNKAPINIGNVGANIDDGGNVDAKQENSDIQLTAT